VSGPLRVNNLSCVIAAATEGIGIATLPQYAANPLLAQGRLIPLLSAYTLPSQEIHAIYPSPRFVPTKVSTWIEFVQARLAHAMWQNARDPTKHSPS
jgi:DNA-binding transcriptional LysR family regulator